MELDKMDDNDWQYLGEGNKSLVVSHVMHPWVLRLLKYPSEDSENPPQTADEAFREIQNIVDFSSNVMSRLLGQKFIHCGEVVRLPLKFVRQLSIKVQHKRPAWRCDKVMDMYSGCALCLPNLTSPDPHRQTHTPPLCIEIKPKCGLLPSSKHVSKDIKTKACRFCMYQHYKVANGKWKRRSHYCPLDLFSGNRQRMHCAIRHLIEEPQNNFKVFKGGQCIYSCKEDTEDSVDSNSLLHHLRPYFLYGNNRINNQMTNRAILNDFIQVLVNALLNSGGSSGGVVADRPGEGWRFCEASPCSRERIRQGSQLPSESVLFRILQTQMLDTLDIEGLFPLYQRVEQHLQDFPEERCHLQIDGPYDDAFFERLQKSASEDDGSVEYAMTKVHQYCVAMTAKDCSVMITLAPSSEEQDDGDDEGESNQRRLWDHLSSRTPSFSYNVSILDLDPKPFDSIPRQMRLDQSIVSYYQRIGGTLPRGSLLPHAGIFATTECDSEDCTLLFHPV